MNDAQFRQLLQRALDALQRASDLEQERLNACATGVICVGGVGQVLTISRNVDTLERCCSELQSVLDQPPWLGAAGLQRELLELDRTDDDAA